MGRVHRCRTPFERHWPISPLEGLAYPGKHDPSQRKLLTGKRARYKWCESVDFGFDFDEIAKRGVVARQQGLMTVAEKTQYDRGRASMDELHGLRWERERAAMIRNMRHDLNFGAFAQKSEAAGLTMWVPAEGYFFEDRYYKFRIDSYFEESWREGLRWARRGKMLVAGNQVDCPPSEIFRSLLMQPGTLSCKPHMSIGVRRSGGMKPPDQVPLDEDRPHQIYDAAWVETIGGKHEEHKTWFWARMMGYPKDPEELEGGLPELGACHISWEGFRLAFGHEPTWDRNKWSKNWLEEYSFLCDLEDKGLLELLRPTKPCSLNMERKMIFVDNTGATGDTEDNYGQNEGQASYRSFCLRVYVVGLEMAFMHEFGHPPTTDMNRWSNNRTAERRAYWVVTGRPHNDPATSRPPFLSNWEDSCDTCVGPEERRDISLSVNFDEHMQVPDLSSV